jgi:hypothetical protein
LNKVEKYIGDCFSEILFIIIFSHLERIIIWHDIVIAGIWVYSFVLIIIGLKFDTYNSFIEMMNSSGY